MAEIFALLSQPILDIIRHLFGKKTDGDKGVGQNAAALICAAVCSIQMLLAGAVYKSSLLGHFGIRAGNWNGPIAGSFRRLRHLYFRNRPDEA